MTSKWLTMKNRHVEILKAIRAGDRSYAEIAAAFDLTPSTISRLALEAGVPRRVPPTAPPPPVLNPAEYECVRDYLAALR